MKRGNRFNDRTGEKFKNNQGDIAIIKKYHSALNSTIEYEDGTIVENVFFSQLKSGQFQKPYNRVGEVYISNEGYNLKIIQYNSSVDVSVEILESGDIISNLQYDNIKRGAVKNPMKISVCDIGFYGIGDYKTTDNKIIYKAHKIWNNMLHRCYSEKRGDRCGSYKNVTVCEEWCNFQNYAKWYEDNYIEKWQVDKDILIKGNKIYSPETCCFVPGEINNLFLKSNSIRGELPIGVHMDGSNFRASVKIAGKVKGLKRCNTPEEAFGIYKEEKEKNIKQIADKWKGQIANNVYEALYNYKVEITD